MPKIILFDKGMRGNPNYNAYDGLTVMWIETGRGLMSYDSNGYITNGFTLTAAGNKVQWYGKNYPCYQLNYEGTTYYWVAIG